MKIIHKTRTVQGGTSRSQKYHRGVKSKALLVLL